jgi:ribosomal protein S18 acetylase RimI-like enzyme
MKIEVIRIDKKQLDELQKISIETFRDTFELQNTKENIDNYISKAFTKDKLATEMDSQNSEFYFIYGNDTIAGYLKINIGMSQTENMGNDCLEVERIYIRKSYQKLGLGKLLLEKAQIRAKECNKNKIWLGVWEKNTNAISFYKKIGFVQKDSHTFYMGEEKQVDYIMMKSL